MKVKELFINDQKEQEIFDDTIIGAILYAYVEYFGEYLTQKTIDNIVYLYEYGVFIKYKNAYSERADHKINDIISLSRDKGINGALVEIAKAFMGHFSKKERQKGGKVYTPQEIVDWIHDKLEEQSPISLEKTYWDPACGTGHFPIDWYDRLMKYWKENREKYPDIPDEHEAHKYIIENCIYFSDIDPFALRLCRLAFFLKDPEVVGLKFNYTCGDSLLDEPFKGREFDYVAMNPPYISKDDLLKEYKEKLTRGFPSYNVSGNIYAAFFDLAIRKVQTTGIYGLISTRYWLKQDWGSNLRTTLSTKTIYLRDLGEIQSFDGTLTFCVVVIGQQITRDKSWYIDVEQKQYEKNLDVFQGKPWIFTSPEEADILKKIENQTNKLSDCLLPQGGFPIRLREAFVLPKEFMIPSTEERYVLPFVVGKDLQKYKFTSTRRMINLLPEEEMNAPALLEYIQEKIKGNTGYSRIGLKDCEHLPQAKRAIFNIGSMKEAILLQYAGPYFKCALAQRNVPCSTLNNVNYFTSKGKDLRIYLAILNSRLLDFWAIRSLSNNDQYTYKFGFDRLKQISFPSIEEAKEKEIIELVNQMLLNPEDKKTQEKIDQIVYKLYGLTEEEIGVVK